MSKFILVLPDDFDKALTSCRRLQTLWIKNKIKDTNMRVGFCLFGFVLYVHVGAVSSHNHTIFLGKLD